MKYRTVLTVTVLLAPAPAHAASGRLILACSGPPSLAGAPRAGWRNDGTFLVFDFDSGMVFHDGGADGMPIRAVKKFFITWASEDGSREGSLNRLTLEAEEVRTDTSTPVRASLACEAHAHLTFKAARSD